MGVNIQPVSSGANEKMRGNSAQNEKPPDRCSNHVISRGAEAISTKPIDFLMFGNEIEMRVERAA
jgi:hypothetical protein